MGFQEATHALERQSLGYSYVRMVPKAGGMRCLVNMSRRQPPAAGKAKTKCSRASINQKLQNLFHVLTFEKTRDPSRVGASVLGLDDVYAKLRYVSHHTTPLVLPLDFEPTLIGQKYELFTECTASSSCVQDMQVSVVGTRAKRV